MTANRHDIVTDRVRINSHRIQFPVERHKCDVCHRQLAGIHAPFGTTEVCARSTCQLVAQTIDRGGVVEKPEQLALTTGDFAQYAGAIVIQQEDAKWALGFVHEKSREVEWACGLEFTALVRLLNSTAGHLVPKTPKQIQEAGKGV